MIKHVKWNKIDIKIPQSVIKLMQKFSNFSMKNKKKWKMGLNDEILDFEGRSFVRSPF